MRFGPTEQRPAAPIEWRAGPDQNAYIEQFNRSTRLGPHPAGAAGMQQVFTTALAVSIESDCVRQRLMDTSDSGEVVEVMSDGMCVAHR
jgi:hypothetical protein